MPAPSTDRSDGRAPPDAALLAPRWHTAALIGVILAVAVTGALLRGHVAAAPPPPSASSRMIAIYLPMIAVQSCLALYVCRIGRPRNALSVLLGRRWTTLGRACVDLTLALCGWLFIIAFELAWARLFAAGAPRSVTAMLPHTWLERLAWVIVSLIVGFCEEIAYRGYLQTQLGAFTGRAGVALVLQALLFGIAHAEQGEGAVVRLAIYGLAFGALARWRRSLLPGIACHAWTNLASGLLRI